MRRGVTTVLKVLIGGLLLIAQAVILPLTAAETARRNPELAFLEIPGILGGILFLALVELVLICVWRLLSLVRDDQIFSARSFRWISIITGALVASSVLILASFLVLLAANAVNPGILVLALLGVVVGIALALLVVVLRSLLAKALELQQDLSEVV